MVSIVKAIVRSIIDFLSAFRIGRMIWREAAQRAMEDVIYVTHSQIGMRFVSPNELTRYRAASFSVKEPDTLAWIDSFENGSVYWDVGANVGLYTIYAALKKGAKVTAFEPSVFNLELLTRNCNLNGVADRVLIVPLPLAREMSTDSIRLSSTTWGGALNTFKESVGQDGKALSNQSFQYRICGLSLDRFQEVFEQQPPDYLKIDVDGIEHLILAGGTQVLRNCRSVIVETNEAVAEQTEAIDALLGQCGLRFYSKAPVGDNLPPELAQLCNKVWKRDH